MARIRQDYQPEYADPISGKAGDPVEVGREDDEFPGWFWCRAKDGREGWVPKELLVRSTFPAKLLEDYSARELAVRIGEQVEILQERHAWAQVRNARGHCGWVPCANLQG